MSGSDGSWGWYGGTASGGATALALGLDPDQRDAACVSGGGEAVTVPEPGCGAAVTMLLSPRPGAHVLAQGWLPRLTPPSPDTQGLLTF